MVAPSNSTRRLHFEEFELDLDSCELHTNGRRVDLQGQPFQILVALLERNGELVTREDLKAKLWPSDTFVDFDHSLNRAVNRLREALRDSAAVAIASLHPWKTVLAIPTVLSLIFKST